MNNNPEVPYIEICYRPDEKYPNNPWMVLPGNLPREYGGKKYRVYLNEVIEDIKEKSNDNN